VDDKIVRLGASEVRVADDVADDVAFWHAYTRERVGHLAPLAGLDA